MFASHLNKLPTKNPCAQCGNPIPAAIWMETDHNNRVHFIWHCVACDYRFQSMAVYDQELERIAA
jgi:hypothetical protein